MTEVFRPLQADDPVAVAGYRPAARLGAGGMGRVYLSHTQGGRPVALKVVRPELADDPDFRRRFRREVTAARRVRGAYTAELIDADPDGTPPWLATVYVPGPSLADAVARRGPLPVAAVLWLMAGVAEALRAIHAEGVVHRDLKPSNVLLAADGPRVIDFGIAVAADGTSYTATGSIIGTPAFMAPEQATGGEVTAATDVFALGQTAAFAALGRPLYGEGPGVNVLYRIVHSNPTCPCCPSRCAAVRAVSGRRPGGAGHPGGDRAVVPAAAGRAGRRGRRTGRVAGDHRAGGHGPGAGARAHRHRPAAAGRLPAARVAAADGSGTRDPQAAHRADLGDRRGGRRAAGGRPGLVGRGHGGPVGCAEGGSRGHRVRGHGVRLARLRWRAVVGVRVRLRLRLGGLPGRGAAVPGAAARSPRRRGRAPRTTPGRTWTRRPR
ncbi:serine/threonine-protein kinase [Streptomyces nogalater]